MDSYILDGILLYSKPLYNLLYSRLRDLYSIYILHRDNVTALFSLFTVTHVNFFLFLLISNFHIPWHTDIVVYSLFGFIECGVHGIKFRNISWSAIFKPFGIRQDKKENPIVIYVDSAFLILEYMIGCLDLDWNERPRRDGLKGYFALERLMVSWSFFYSFLPTPH